MQAALCGFSLAVAPNEACYVPLAHRQRGGGEGLFDAGLEPEQIRESEAIDAIKPVLEDSGILKIGHNLKFNWLIFAQRGIRVAPLDDTLLQSYVLDAGRQAHDVATLAVRYLDHTTIDFEALTGTGKARVDFRQYRDQEGRRIFRGKCRHHAAAVAGAQAPAHRRPHDQRLRDAGAAVGAGARAHGAARHLHRPASAGAAVGRVRQGIRAARGRDPEDRRDADQSRQPETIGRRAVRQSQSARRHENQNRRVVHVGFDPRRPRRTGPRIAAENSRLAAGLETALDLYRRAAELRASENAARAYELRAGGHADRPARRRPNPTCRTSRSATSRAGKSAAPSSRTKATSSSRPTIRRSNCGCSRKSPRCRRCGRRSGTAPTFTP